MTPVFDRGNAFLNNLVFQTMSVQPGDHILEIGCGPGNLIRKMARKIDGGYIEGVDFSKTMTSVARNRNKGNITDGRVKVVAGDFDEMSYGKETFSKACSVNTLYFWPEPVSTAGKISDVLKPGGELFLAFEDKEQLKRRKLDWDVFRLYSTDDVRRLLVDVGFSDNVRVVSGKKRGSVFHCVVAMK
jgi:ubiquinone/menaquinone biosynthesis C-methylase UbiE